MLVLSKVHPTNKPQNDATDVQKLVLAVLHVVLVACWSRCGSRHWPQCWLGCIYRYFVRGRTNIHTCTVRLCTGRNLLRVDILQLSQRTKDGKSLDDADGKASSSTCRQNTFLT